MARLPSAGPREEISRVRGPEPGRLRGGFALVTSSNCNRAARKPADEAEKLVPGGVRSERRVAVDEARRIVEPRLPARILTKHVAEVVWQAEVEIRSVQRRDERLLFSTRTWMSEAL